MGMIKLPEESIKFFKDHQDEIFQSGNFAEGKWNKKLSEYINKTKKICEKFFSDELTINITEGGSTRQLSSKNGCKNLEKYKPKKILIHDVARPFINKDLITIFINNLLHYII